MVKNHKLAAWSTKQAFDKHGMGYDENNKVILLKPSTLLNICSKC